MSEAFSPPRKKKNDSKYTTKSDLQDFLFFFLFERANKNRFSCNYFGNYEMEININFEGFRALAICKGLINVASLLITTSLTHN